MQGRKTLQLVEAVLPQTEADEGLVIKYDGISQAVFLIAVQFGQDVIKGQIIGGQTTTQVTVAMDGHLLLVGPREEWGLGMSPTEERDHMVPTKDGLTAILADFCGFQIVQPIGRVITPIA